MTDRILEENTGKGSPDKALLLGMEEASAKNGDAAKSLDELESLVRNIDLVPLRKTLVKLKGSSARYVLGTGKAEEVRALAEELGAGIIVFDNPLTPSQQRNWEELTGRCVIDRNEVILEIFADRAFTKEAQLQVELARMEYSLPRLTRAWTHLSRQRGGARGNKGSGETQLEIDRRRILEKIVRAKKELKKVRAQRETQRARRRRTEISVVSIVGYTNAGKSSLLKALTGNEVLIADQLFATLDPTTRRLTLPSGGEALLTDTVGFIRNLPHTLVDAFKSTLEETLLADLLLHVVDASDPEAAAQAKVTREVLGQIGVEGKPVVTVLNKIDIAGNVVHAPLEDRAFDGAVRVSAATGEGLGELLARIDEILGSADRKVRYSIPASRHDLVAMLHRGGRVLSEEYTDAGVEIVAQVSGRLRGLLEAYEAASAS